MRSTHSNFYTSGRNEVAGEGLFEGQWKLPGGPARAKLPYVFPCKCLLEKLSVGRWEVVWSPCATEDVRWKFNPGQGRYESFILMDIEVHCIPASRHAVWARHQRPPHPEDRGGGAEVLQVLLAPPVLRRAPASVPSRKLTHLGIGTRWSRMTMQSRAFDDLFGYLFESKVSKGPHHDTNFFLVFPKQFN